MYWRQLSVSFERNLFLAQQPSPKVDICRANLRIECHLRVASYFSQYVNEKKFSLPEMILSLQVETMRLFSQRTRDC